MDTPITDGFTQLDGADSRKQLQGPIVAANNDRNLEVWGTAFLIAKGWAMTAKHVVMDYLKSIGGIDVFRGGAITAGFAFPIHLYILGAVGQSMVFGVTRIYYNEITDIALLRLTIQEEKGWESLGEFPTLQLLPPKVGESISVVGCPHSYLDHSVNNVREIHTFPRISTGVVRDVHEMMRDRNLNFPCFHTSARVLGRMSGSPIFNCDGYICGVAVYSMQQDDSFEPISYGATLWPVAGIKCDGEPSLVNGVATFFDVMRRGHVKVIDLDQVLVAMQHGNACVVNLKIAAQAGWTPNGNVIYDLT